MSKKIQNGEHTIINAIMNPNGFVYNADLKLPSIIKITDRVEPHDGHGMLVAASD